MRHRHAPSSCMFVLWLAATIPGCSGNDTGSSTQADDGTSSATMNDDTSEGSTTSTQDDTSTSSGTSSSTGSGTSQTDPSSSNTTSAGDDTSADSGTSQTDATSGTSVSTSGADDDSDTSGSDDGGDVDDEPIGWAAVAGLGQDSTFGGRDGNEVTVTSADELIDYAARDEPWIIHIDGSFVIPELQVASHKTLIGTPGGATLHGGLRIRGSADSPVINVIVRNLSIDASTADNDGDGVAIYYAHHVWIDHCEVFDAPDGNLDIVHAADYVTVSWTKFFYSSEAPDLAHRFSNLIGHTEPNDEDIDALKVTFHHDWWAEMVHERMPRVRYGRVHLLNNYYSSAGNNYAVRAGHEANILIEGNVFDGIANPHEIDDDTAVVTATDNLYLGTTGARDTRDLAFAPPYAYTPDAVDTVADTVMQNAGPQ